jgi:hypothetical protein
MTLGMTTRVSARSSRPRLPVGAGSVAVFAGLLYLTWCGAWVCERALASHVSWLRTDYGAFLYWTTAKLVLWVLPALALIHRPGRSLAAVLGLRRLRALFLWGGGVGLVLVANGLPLYAHARWRRSDTATGTSAHAQTSFVRNATAFRVTFILAFLVNGIFEGLNSHVSQ